MSYPDEISLEPNSSEYTYFMEHSDFFREGLADTFDTVELSSDTLFGGDRKKWELFIDIFFPAITGKSIFNRPQSKQQILEDIHDIFEYLQMDPVKGPVTLKNKNGQEKTVVIARPNLTQKKARNTLKNLIGIPKTVPRGTAPQKIEAAERQAELNRQQRLQQLINNNTYYNSYYDPNFYRNNSTSASNDTNNSGVPINVGLSEEAQQIKNTLNKRYNKYFNNNYQGRTLRQKKKGKKQKRATRHSTK
jgi:hypothetical protein